MSQSIRPTLVVGCQRSGTLITSKILADYLDADHIDEFEFLPIGRGINPINKLLDVGRTNLVIHCPAALTGWKPIYEAIPNIRFVGVKRNPTDILESMKPIKWLEKEDKDEWEEFLNQQIKTMNDLWQELKQTMPEDNWREIEYESLQDHPLFIKKENRKDFFVKQWNLTDREGPRYWKEDIKWVE